MSLADVMAATAAKKGAAPTAEEKQLDPTDLWIALTSLPRPSQEVTFPRCFPGTSTPIGSLLMWPLTQEEQMAANAAADRFTKELMKDPQRKEDANLGYHHTYTNEVAIQVLFRACRDAKNIERPAFPSPTQMRGGLSTDETGVLFSTYCTVQSELGPIRAHMTAEEADALILRLAEGGSTFPLDSYSWEQQRSLAASMASRLVACWTAMSSVGLQPDVSTFALQLLANQQAAQEAKEEEPSGAEESPTEE
jgi:hypothetical protein